HSPDFHAALDIRAPMGTPIRPIKEGMVIQTGWREGYGMCIEIIHPDGYLSLYGHCSKIFVEKGMIVSKDDIIGAIGSTGRSTGPHLHFEMKRHGENVNPLFFIW
ncbi:MAG TPA: M23 family metallopeptidase, partial [Spirochaetota bacterium]